jgi:hypothetical protein
MTIDRCVGDVLRRVATWLPSGDGTIAHDAPSSLGNVQVPPGNATEDAPKNVVLMPSPAKPFHGNRAVPSGFQPPRMVNGPSNVGA